MFQAVQKSNQKKGFEEREECKKRFKFVTLLYLENPSESTDKLLELMRVLQGHEKKSIFKN